MSIREIRAVLGLSQQKFADYFGIPVANIQHWEQGISTPPKYVTSMMERILVLENKLKEA